MWTYVIPRARTPRARTCTGLCPLLSSAEDFSWTYPNDLTDDPGKYWCCRQRQLGAKTEAAATQANATKITLTEETEAGTRCEDTDNRIATYEEFFLGIP